jgi:hypothetical protein
MSISYPCGMLISPIPKSQRPKLLAPASPLNDSKVYNLHVNRLDDFNHCQPARKKHSQLGSRFTPKKNTTLLPSNPLISALLSSRQFETNHWRSICDVSLTLKQGRAAENGSWVRIDALKCEEAFRFFMRLLNAAVFGKKATRRFVERRLKVIPVLEKNRAGRWHLHAAVEPPAHLTFAEFETLIRHCWSKVYWAYDENLVRPNADRGWIEYMLKESQKSGLESWSDTIIWNCLYNPIDGA